MERGAQFLHAEQARYVEDGHTVPGRNVEVAFTQFQHFAGLSRDLTN